MRVVAIVVALLVGIAPASAQTDPSTAAARARVVDMQRAERLRARDHEPAAAIGLDVTGAILTVGGITTLITGLIVACAGCDRVGTSAEHDAFWAAMVGAGAMGVGLILFLVAAGLHFGARARREHGDWSGSLALGPSGGALVIPFD